MEGVCERGWEERKEDLKMGGAAIVERERKMSERGRATGSSCNSINGGEDTEEERRRRYEEKEKP